MKKEITLTDLFDNDAIFDQIIWNLISQLDSNDDPSKTINQLKTLKLVNKHLYQIVQSYISRTKANVAQKYKLYIDHSGMIKEYDIDKLVKISHYPNEAYLNNSLNCSQYYDQLKNAVLPSFLWDYSTFRLNIKVTLNKNDLRSIYFGHNSHDIIDQNFLSIILPLSQTFLHKYEIEYILSAKNEFDPDISVGKYFISEHWSYSLLTLLIKFLNDIKQFKLDLKYLIENNVDLELIYDVPLSANSNNPFLLLKEDKLNEMYNVCIKYHNQYLAFYDNKSTYSISSKSNNINEDFVSLNKIVAVCWPSPLKMKDDTAFLTCNKACISGIESKLSNEFLKSVSNIHNSF